MGQERFAGVLVEAVGSLLCMLERCVPQHSKAECRAIGVRMMTDLWTEAHTGNEGEMCEERMVLAEGDADRLGDLLQEVGKYNFTDTALKGRIDSALHWHGLAQARRRSG